MVNNGALNVEDDVVQTTAEQRAAVVAAQNAQLAEPVHEEVVLTFHDRMKRIKLVLFLMLIVGLAIGIISPMVPDLQNKAFGNNMFSYTGYLAAAKGFFAACYNPVFGAVSDHRGRKMSIVLSMFLSVIPFSIYVATKNFLAYAIADVFLGQYAATLSLSMAAITDRIPRACGMRTESFAMCVCMFFLGMGLGPFVGIFVTPHTAFLISLVIQFFGSVFALYFFPTDDPRKLGAERAGLLANGDGTAPAGTASPAAAPAVCPFGPHTSQTAKTAACVAVESAEDVAAAADAEATRVGDPTASTMRAQHEEIAKITSAPVRVFRLLLVTPNLRVIAVAIFFNFMCVQLLEQLLLQYLQQTLNFGDTDQAVMIAIMALTALAALVFLVPLFKKRFGVLTTFKISLVGNFLQSFLLAFIRTKWEGYTVPLLGVISMCAYPCASALAGASVSDELAGTAQGVAASARQVAEGISPLAFGIMMQAVQNTVFPGAPFIVGAGCVLVSFIVVQFYTFKAAK